MCIIISHKGALGSNTEAIMDYHMKRRVDTNGQLPEIRKIQLQGNQQNTSEKYLKILFQK